MPRRVVCYIKGNDDDEAVVEQEEEEEEERGWKRGEPCSSGRL